MNQKLVPMSFPSQSMNYLQKSYEKKQSHIKQQIYAVYHHYIYILYTYIYIYIYLFEYHKISNFGPLYKDDL